MTWTVHSAELAVLRAPCLNCADCVQKGCLQSVHISHLCFHCALCHAVFQLYSFNTGGLKMCPSVNRISDWLYTFITGETQEDKWSLGIGIATVQLESVFLTKDLQSSLQLFTALKTPAGFHEQIRSLERAKVRHRLMSLKITGLCLVVICSLVSILFTEHSTHYSKQTGTFLKHKLCSRPERSELIRMHILQGSGTSLRVFTC